MRDLEDSAMKGFGRVLMTGLLLAIFSGPAEATIWPCMMPDCPAGAGEARGPNGFGAPPGGLNPMAIRYQATFRREAWTGSKLQQRYLDRTHAPTAANGSFVTETLTGDLAGDWDVVTGFVTFPFSFDGIETDYLLVRGLPTERLSGGDTYQVGHWKRAAYWIDAGDGVPRLLASELLNPNYVPSLEDPFVDGGELNYAQLVLYREQGRDYSAYTEEAAFGNLFFVVDPASGEVINAAIDLYDAGNLYEKTVFLFEGDSLLPLLISYKLAEPEFLYFAEYGDFITLSQEFNIGLADHVPGRHFVDPALSNVGFDAAAAPLNLLLEGFASVPGDDPLWAYSDVFPLNYTWNEAGQIFESDFEPLVGETTSTLQRSVVRQRSD